MTNLSFTKKNGKWYGEFTATKPFIVQVKKTGGTTVSLGMSIDGTTEYDNVEGSVKSTDFYCKQFNGEVWPINIAVICESEPTSGGYLFQE